MNRVIFLIVAMTMIQSISAGRAKADTPTSYTPVIDSIAQTIENDQKQMQTYMSLHQWTSKNDELYKPLFTQLWTARGQMETFYHQNGYTDLTDKQVSQIQDDLKTFQQAFDHLNVPLRTQPTPTPTATPASIHP